MLFRSRLLSKSKYAFLPGYNGASLRHTTISTAISHKLIVYSHIGRITPALLRPGGEYNNALVLMQDSEWQNYADKVFADFLQRESDSSKITTTLAHSHRLFQQHLDPNHIARQHIELVI